MTGSGYSWVMVSAEKSGFKLQFVLPSRPCPSHSFLSMPLAGPSPKPAAELWPAGCPEGGKCVRLKGGSVRFMWELFSGIGALRVARRGCHALSFHSGPSQGRRATSFVVDFACTELRLFCSEVLVVPAEMRREAAGTFSLRASSRARFGSRGVVSGSLPRGMAAGTEQLRVQRSSAAFGFTRPFRAGKPFDPVVQTGKSSGPATTKMCCGRR